MSNKTISRKLCIQHLMLATKAFVVDSGFTSKLGRVEEVNVGVSGTLHLFRQPIVLHGWRLHRYHRSWPRTPAGQFALNQKNLMDLEALYEEYVDVSSISVLYFFKRKFVLECSQLATSLPS